MLGALLRSSVVRLIPVGLMLIALQKTLLVEMQPFGIVIQVVLAFAAAAGAAAGPERGVIAGFTLGIMFDLAVGTPLGSAALVMALAGVTAGAVTLIRIDLTWWLAAIFTTLGAAVGEFATPVLRAFIGQDDTISTQVFRVVPVVALAAGLLSLVFVPVAGWLMKVRAPDWKLADG